MDRLRPWRGISSRTTRLRFVSLFSGIGGLDLGLERAGFRCAAQVEISPFCRMVLARHWPRVPRFEDIREFKRSHIYGRIHLVAGGFPCQDVSNAGNKKGIGGERSGLWKQMLRVIRSLRPPLVLVENVSALRSRGIDTVLRDLAACGYDAEWDCIPACAIGAPHIRDRVFVVAYSKRLRWNGPSIFAGSQPAKHRAWASAENRQPLEIVGRSYRRYPAHLRMDDGFPNGLDRMHGCGNAVVPQVAEYVGTRIMAELLHRPTALRLICRIPPTARFSRAARFSSKPARRVKKVA